MTDMAVKKKMDRAIIAAAKMLNSPKDIEGRKRIIFLKDSPFHIEYIRDKEIRKIRITLDEISKDDERLVKEFRLPILFCTKEIWCRKGKNFISKEIL